MRAANKPLFPSLFPSQACNSGCQNISETERWISVGTGLAMLTSGLTRGSTTGGLLMLLGGGLLYRGLTGHCSVYEALELSTAEEPRRNLGHTPAHAA